MAARSGERLPECRKALPDQGKEAVANEIPVEALIKIALIRNPFEPVLLRVGFERLARNAEQRPQNSPALEPGRLPHGGDPLQARPPEKLQQQGFGLVVLVLGEHDMLRSNLFECSIARDACSSLDSG